jgi:2-polyprenyl-3-methyl-5-hydroxy-6-metoxy-1,4-benzoquinol methylase
MLIVKNTNRSNLCVCCQSNNVSMLGLIEYAKVTVYANSRVELTSQPELWECNDCRSWFTENRVSEKDSVDLYSSGQSWVSKGLRISKEREVVKSIEILFQPGLKVLDVGCANGALLDFAQENGSLTYGLEYSERNRLVLEKKGHKNYSNWSEIDTSFDLIIGFDLIEHLYDLQSFIDSCRKHLNEDGLLVIMTGDVSSPPAQKSRQKWWYVRYPEHIVFPSAKWLKSLPGFKHVETKSVYPYRLADPLRTIKRLFLSWLNPQPGSLPPSALRRPDHMILVLQKIDT